MSGTAIDRALERMLPLTRAEKLLTEFANEITVTFEIGDDGQLTSDRISLLAGDSNCPHQHRYDPKTGHGYTVVEEEWTEGDTGLDSLSRLLDEVDVLREQPYECAKCEVQRKRT